MRIDSFKTENNKDKVKVSATVLWEESGRPPQVVFFETDARFADGFSCNPHAFLVACILPAMRFGEKRIYIDAEICPDLLDGLVTAICWMRHWGRYKNCEELINIESKILSKPRITNSSRRAGLFFSGGIDSLATLKINHLNYDTRHPGYISDGILVCGLEVYEPEKFEHVVNNVSKIAHDAGINLIPVCTNIRSLGPEDRIEFWSDFWIPEYEGAGFASIAHTFANRFSTVYLSSDDDIPKIPSPWGSHPLINPNYSSSDLSFKLAGMTLTRFEKTKLIADWEIALQNLRICNASAQYQSGVLNCGECEKCLRTKLAFHALGALKRTSAFRNSDISPKFLSTMLAIDDTSIPDYGEDLIEALAEIGSHDLANIIQRKLFLAKLKRLVRKSTIEKIKEFDAKNLNGNLLKLKRSIYKKSLFH